jgi:hypothetical protein
VIDHSVKVTVIHDVVYMSIHVIVHPSRLNGKPIVISRVAHLRSSCTKFILLSQRYGASNLDRRDGSGYWEYSGPGGAGPAPSGGGGAYLPFVAGSLGGMALFCKKFSKDEIALTSGTPEAAAGGCGGGC